MADNLFFRYGAENSYRVVAAVRRNGDLTFDIGFSFCAPNDAFIKELGRNIALGRLNAGRMVTVTADQVEFCEGVYNAAMASAIEYDVRPSWLPQKVWF